MKKKPVTEPQVELLRQIAKFENGCWSFEDATLRALIRGGLVHDDGRRRTKLQRATITKTSMRQFFGTQWSVCITDAGLALLKAVDARATALPTDNEVPT